MGQQLALTGDLNIPMFEQGILNIKFRRPVNKKGDNTTKLNKGNNETRNKTKEIKHNKKTSYKVEKTRQTLYEKNPTLIKKNHYQAKRNMNLYEKEACICMNSLSSSATPYFYENMTNSSTLQAMVIFQITNFHHRLPHGKLLYFHALA